MRPHLLPRAVRSIMEQTGVGLELIVVDDNRDEARDRSLKALEPWRADPRLRILLNRDSRNAATARNTGLHAARGKWIAYLDDDDAYAPGKLEAQYRLAEAAQSPIVLCGLRYRLGPRSRVHQCEKRVFSGRELLLSAQATTQVLFHRRDPAALYDPGFDAAEDQELFLRLVERWNLTEVPNVPEPLVDVYPQAMDARVNALSPVLWRAQRRIALRYAPRYGREARRHLAARAALLRERNRPEGDAGALWRASRRLLAAGGTGECRLILNTWALRVPGLRRLVVN
jgi:glycosyltransferase involved in cell wall biosynthesis